LREKWYNVVQDSRKAKKHDKYETKSNPPLEISTSLQIKLDRNIILISEKKHKNNRRELSIAIMFMHVFCEKCIEMVLFGVTLLPFLTETDRLALYVFIQNSGV